jgi:DNA-binding transcriptional ArsR family regulator
MNNFVVLSMTNEGRDVAKVLSNETAIKILNKLAEKRMSASEIAKELNLPISTVQYNLDLLKNAALIKDTAYRYSEKGKKVLYYEPAKKVIILAPEKEKESILNVLKDKFLVPIILAISLGVGFIGQALLGREVPNTSFEATAGKTAAAPLVTDAASLSHVAFYQQSWFIFFLGALFATAIFVVVYSFNRVWK